MKVMLRMICLGVAVSCSALVACGGAIQQEDESRETSGGPKQTLSAAIPAAGTPYGTWELVSLEGMPGGKPSTQTYGHLSLELRNDDTAIARLCTKPYFEVDESTYRCADESAYECLYGSVDKNGSTWRVTIPGLGSTSRASGGAVVTDETDKLIVRDILPKYASGTFTRATGDSPTRSCAGR